MSSPRELDAASFGVAGAITDQVGQLTNVPWTVSAAELKRGLTSSACICSTISKRWPTAVTVLAGDELAVLQEGTRVASGNVAVIAAGTGLGEGVLLNIDGRLVPGESEGGHADFAARTPRELEMVAALTRVFGRVSAEHILSGPGRSISISSRTRRSRPGQSVAATAGARRRRDPQRARRSATVDGSGGSAGARSRPRRWRGAAPDCVETLELFVAAYGAEAGNMALRVVATAGVYVGGGIAPRILPALRDGRFMHAFRAKAPLHELVRACRWR